MTINKLLFAAMIFYTAARGLPQAPVRVAIVGLVHGHVKDFLEPLPSNHSAELVAIVEPDQALSRQYAEQYQPEADALLHRY